MRFIGVHLGKNSSVTVINDSGELEFFAQCERFKRVKNYGGFLYKVRKPAISSLIEYFPELEQLKLDDFCVMAAVSDAVFPQEPLWRQVNNVSQNNRWLFGKRSVYDPSIISNYEAFGDKNFVFWTLGRNPDAVISHNLAQVISSYCFREEDSESLFIASHTMSPNAMKGVRSSLIGTISPEEITIHWDATPIPPITPLTALIGPDSFNAVVALAAQEVKIDFESLLKNTVQFSMNEHTHQSQFPCIHKWKGGLKKRDREYVASFYRWYLDQIIWPAIESNVKKYRPQSLVLGGTTFGNCELNTKLYQLVNNVLVGPAYDESGLSLGAAAFAFFHQQGRFPKFVSPSFQGLQKPLESVGPQSPTDIAMRLANGSIVGLLRENAEIGPHALGYRTILASAKNRNNRKWISALKKRSSFQPLSCMVTTDQFNRFFKGPRGRFMEYQVEANEDGRKMLPAIVHTNGTARPQVVYKSDPWLYELLKRYGEISGVECLATTSLNNRNKPICNTVDDVLFEMPKLEFVSIGSQKSSRLLI